MNLRTGSGDRERSVEDGVQNKKLCERVHVALRPRSTVRESKCMNLEEAHPDPRDPNKSVANGQRQSEGEAEVSANYAPSGAREGIQGGPGTEATQPRCRLTCQLVSLEMPVTLTRYPALLLARGGGKSRRLAEE